ncbi:hypothetical protein [Aurantiacibacter sediminis]|uniref:Uncharacterized protein n=1 Tax=Aurantiacibacter sediminis TaxID=2793064 RepID=A0ABS0N2E9_9SPHN|nr:hypothetical protein [Aurantiacibacter sediminis]
MLRIPALDIGKALGAESDLGQVQRHGTGDKEQAGRGKGGLETACLLATVEVSVRIT